MTQTSRGRAAVGTLFALSLQELAGDRVTDSYLHQEVFS